MVNIPKGTKDVLPSDSYKWHAVYKVIDKLAKRYNLKEIMTPTFEHTELFVRGVGDSSDIVNKEMYTFLDKGERSITLKPEGTAGVARSFIENGLFNNAMPLKTFYKTPCFRYEKPQAGRLREHHQFGVEMFGSDNPESDIEIFMLLNDFFNEFGISPTFSINYLGCKECNAVYKDKLRGYVKPYLKNMCPDCNNRYEKNVLRVLDCKSRECQSMLVDAPKLSDNLCTTCAEKFGKIQETMQDLGLRYRIDTNLVRGLDYYTGVVFEILNIDKTSGQTALGGGGRYNNLVEDLGGKSTPVVGFGLGIERFILYLESIGYVFPEENNVDVYVASATNNMSYILNLAKSMRNAGLGVETDLMARGLKAQFKYADKLNCRFVVIVGDDEINAGELTIKDMKVGTQERIKEGRLVQYILERL